jgi:hypothetical protein
MSVCGCKKNDPPKKADLRPRLEAAMQITNSNDRDSALKTVAVDSAGLGAGDITLEALAHMFNSSFRDETASDCASRLAKAQQLSFAKDVAKTIVSSNLRDETLKKLAEGV